jgi:hypothetical protein
MAIKTNSLRGIHCECCQKGIVEVNKGQWLAFKFNSSVRVIATVLETPRIKALEKFKFSIIEADAGTKIEIREGGRAVTATAETKAADIVDGAEGAVGSAQPQDQQLLR